MNEAERAKCLALPPVKNWLIIRRDFVVAKRISGDLRRLFQGRMPMEREQ
jgi:hypothetical protein